MSGADDLMHSVGRLSAALDRIAKVAPRLLESQIPENPAVENPTLETGAKPAEAQIYHEAPAPQIMHTAPATPNADIAARLDSLIEQLRTALSSTSG